MKKTINEEVLRFKHLMNINESFDDQRQLARLNAPEKSKINRDLQKLMKPTYFNEIPLGQIFELLEKHGLVPLQEDQTKWSGMLLGAESHTIFELAYLSSGKEGNNNITTYTRIDNAGLSLSWYKMGSGRYEVIAYIS